METLNNESGCLVDRYSSHDVNMQVVIGLVMSLLIVATVVGNAMVLIAVLTQKPLQVTSNFFLVSLAMADLLVGLIVMPLAMLDRIFGYRFFGSQFCDFWSSLNVMLTSASILSLCIISVDRYLIITEPLKYKQKMSYPRALFLIVCTWCVSTIASFLPVQMQWHTSRTARIAMDTNSTDAWPRCLVVVSETYALCTSVVLFFLPLVLIMYTYSQIFKAAREQAARIDVLPSDDGPIGHKSWYSRFKHKKQNIKGKKAMKTLGIIVGAFLVTWLPYYVYTIIEAYCLCINPELHTFFVWLGYFNSTINPIIYPMLMRDFRKVLLKVCKRTTGSGVTRTALSSTMRATLSVVCDGSLPVPNHNNISFYCHNDMVQSA
ncbi:5-hydroxytryptamine receptor 6-like [Ptychodera flava]|uniref:5-hydroxytryptamine receptor 6-like n=1 Tax=Ptychodera flava TaxID=63121 RepID=UPI00396A5FC3